MAERHPVDPHATAGLPDSGDPKTSHRRNIPILMLLQGDTVGKKFLLNKRQLNIGRSPDSDLVLTDSEVSRKHSAIVYENCDQPEEMPRCFVHDLNSKNGTLVNGKRVVSMPLKDRDIITIGQAVLGFYLKDEVEIKFDAQLFSMATVDSLTGLYNKYYFQRTYQREYQRATRGNTPLTLFFIDVDEFKKINDTFGHVSGDAVLRKIGEILMHNMREYDVCGRYGGEEFTVALPSTTLEAAEIVAERLRRMIEETEFVFREQIIPTTVSIGLASTEDSAIHSPEDLIHAADQALYRAKQQGRNRVEAAKAPLM